MGARLNAPKVHHRPLRKVIGAMGIASARRIEIGRHPILDLSQSHCLSHSSDEAMVLIDWAFYPHIRDLILDFAPEEAIPTLRLTQRAVRDAVDRRIAEHAVYVIDPPRLYTKRGHIGLSFESRGLKWRTRMLDVHAGTTRGYGRNEGLPAHFPSVQFVRLHGQTSSGVVERLLEGLTPPMVSNPKLSRAHFLGEDLYVHSVREQPLPVAIQPVVSRRTEDYHIALGTFLTGAYSRLTKLIAVLPQDLSKLHCDEIEFGISGETEDTELVVLFLPSFNPEPPADELLLKCKYSYHKFSWDIHGAFMCDAGRLTIVGLKTWEENTGDPDPEMSWEAAFQEIVDEEGECTPDWNPVPKVRTLTIEEWRKEISEEEWVAVESLPGCCWEMCANYEAELVS